MVLRHAAAKHIIRKSSAEHGAAATEGVHDKERRYPATAGRSVIPCALESWGYTDAKVEALLDEFSVLASQRQRDRGLLPSRWRSRWRILLSVGLAMDIGKALLAAMPTHVKPVCALRELIHGSGNDQ